LARERQQSTEVETQRIRKKRVLSNVARLGEISSTEKISMGQSVSDVNILEEDGELLYTPTNYKESLSY
jgi:hypothetical protein